MTPLTLISSKWRGLALKPAGPSTATEAPPSTGSASASRRKATVSAVVSASEKTARVATPTVPQSTAASTINSRPPRPATRPDAATDPDVGLRRERDIGEPILSTRSTKLGGQDQPGHASGVPASPRRGCPTPGGKGRAAAGE